MVNFVTSIATKVPKKPKPAAEPEPPPVGPVYQMVPIDSVHLDPANVRRHPDRNLAAIRASLARFGQQRPIVVDGNGIVRAGNGTLDAARALGWSEIAVVRTGLAGSEATAYAIADNRSADLAEWDGVGLVETLRALQSEEFDLAAIGYTADEIDALVEEMGTAMRGEPAADPGAQIDKAAELQEKWGTATGQLWAIPSKATRGGEHRLLCGDSTKAADVGRMMAGEKAALCLTDPPYNVGKVFGQSTDDNRPDYEAWCFCCHDLLLDVCDAILLTPGIANLGMWLKREPRWVIAWLKKNSMKRITIGFNCWEPVLFWGKAPLYLGGDYVEVPIVVQENIGDHPTPKPVDLFFKLIGGFSEAGTIVCDPFLGSGTTLVAAEQTGRLCRGLEIEPKYVAVALERLAGMGLEPRLAS